MLLDSFIAFSDIILVALLFSRPARKGLLAMPRREAEKMVGTLEGLRPDHWHPRVTPLQGARGVFRLRQGNWRAVFEWQEGELIIKKVAHRKEVYR